MSGCSQGLRCLCTICAALLSITGKQALGIILPLFAHQIISGMSVMIGDPQDVYLSKKRYVSKAPWYSFMSADEALACLRGLG